MDIHKENQMQKNQALIEFTNEVNRLCKEECDRINADPKAIFGAEHHDYQIGMMKLYFDRGYTPAETIEIMNAEYEAEGRAEDMGS